MAKKESKPDSTEAVVLCDCGFGKVGNVVTLPPDDIAVGVTHGMLDDHPDAIRAAKQ